MLKMSLTSVADREDGKIKLDIGAPHLTQEQTKQALVQLNSLNFVENYPKLDRQYVDPDIPQQMYSLFSFVPSKGAKPDKDGVFGMAKIRGTYATQPECSSRAEKILREVDSYHEIHTVYTGKPFPITTDEKFFKNMNVVDIKAKTQEVISEDVKEKRAKEREDIEDAKRKEKALLDAQNKEIPEDPMTKYTTLCIKKAQLTYTLCDNMKKLSGIKDNILRARDEIAKMDKEYPDFRESYYKQYMDARRQAGLKNESTIHESFMKFLCEDIDISSLTI